MAFDAAIAMLSFALELPIHFLTSQICKLSYFFAIFHPVLGTAGAIHHCQGTLSDYKITPSWPYANSQGTTKPR